MDRGHVYLNQWQEFESGAVKPKWFVVLNKPDTDGSLAYAICTSKTRFYEPLPQSPCHSARFGFVIRGRAGCFTEDIVVVQFNQVILCPVTEFSREIRYGRYQHKGALPEMITRQLMNCANKSKDRIPSAVHPLLK